MMAYLEPIRHPHCLLRHPHCLLCEELATQTLFGRVSRFPVPERIGDYCAKHAAESLVAMTRQERDLLGCRHG